MKTPIKISFIAGITGLALAFIASPAAANNQAGAPLERVELQTHVLVEEDVVRLGDLFLNAGQSAETPVAYAPKPGEQAVFDARWLYRVARGYKLDWQPLSAAISVTIERASVIIPRDEIKAEIMFALAEQSFSDDMDIEFSTRFNEIHLPVGSSATVKVASLNYNARSGRFTALIAADSPGRKAEPLRLSGRVFRTVEVPVLKHRVLRGDIIQERDIKWVKLKADRVQEDVIIHLDDLIGRTPKRGVRAGVVVRDRDVQRPLLVQKGKLVTIIHKVRNMMLTAQGKALQSGADGDVVQIKNQQSKQVIEAEVIGPGRVAVRTLAQQISMNVN